MSVSVESVCSVCWLVCHALKSSCKREVLITLSHGNIV
uniref:Uncharacterized protein n=1 Tax=Anguilla anguilla TaxID=7936 RepID=A0A0E9R9M6_ANGAN